MIVYDHSEQFKTSNGTPYRALPIHLDSHTHQRDKLNIINKKLKKTIQISTFLFYHTRPYIRQDACRNHSRHIYPISLNKHLTCAGVWNIYMIETFRSCVTPLKRVSIIIYSRPIRNIPQHQFTNINWCLTAPICILLAYTTLPTFA